MSKYLTIALALPALLSAEAPQQIDYTEPGAFAQEDPLAQAQERTPSNTFFELNPLSLSIGAGIRQDIANTLKAREHSIRVMPGFRKDFLGIATYKYSLLNYSNSSPSSSYKGIGLKLGMAHTTPFADLQFISGWRYNSGPFKWGQVELNALPLALALIGASMLLGDKGEEVEDRGAALLAAGAAAALSFNLAF